jgi:hypothetical protein
VQDVMRVPDCAGCSASSSLCRLFGEFLIVQDVMRVPDCAGCSASS